MPPKTSPQSSSPSGRDLTQQLLDRILQCKEEGFTVQDLGDLAVHVQQEPFEMDDSGYPEFSPCFFEPMTHETLFRHPVDAAILGDIVTEDPYTLYYEDFDTEAAKQPPETLELTKRIALKPYRCTRMIWGYIQSQIYSVPRTNMVKRLGGLKDVTSWQRVCGIEENVEDLHPLLRDLAGHDGLSYSTVETLDWNSKGPKVPHLVLAILMLSLMGPQHGRLLQAHLADTHLASNGHETLVIRCSKVHSFERQADAPFELFYRYLLSTPVGVTFTQGNREERLTTELPYRHRDSGE
ncbi:hypothetical protein VTN77DRAFT_1517 [Rasamsonia byssochlamydoides]|uniref:uncharacterized protein n=1 Tax=Rasamsonia byssochlamydoides TaxID=89139 RepID=UPI0037447962